MNQILWWKNRVPHVIGWYIDCVVYVLYESEYLFGALQWMEVEYPVFDERNVPEMVLYCIVYINIQIIYWGLTK